MSEAPQSQKRKLTKSAKKRPRAMVLAWVSPEFFTRWPGMSEAPRERPLRIFGEGRDIQVYIASTQQHRVLKRIPKSTRPKAKRGSK